MNAGSADIVVATDFSDGAWRAALRAARLSTELRTRAPCLVHVLDDPWFAALRDRLEGADVAFERLLDEARRAMRALIESLFEASGVRFDGVVRSGPVVATLVETAADAPLLVLGARGEHPVRDFVLGTSAERVLRKRDGSVLVVRGEVEGPYRRLLAAVDFSVPSPEVVRQARALAPEASLDVLHAFEVPYEGGLRLAGVDESVVHAHRLAARREAIDAMRLLLDGLGETRAQRIVECGYPPRLIVERAREGASDLVAVGKHGRTAVEDLLLGSVTLHVLGEASGDVLVVSAQSSNGSPT